MELVNVTCVQAMVRRATTARKRRLPPIKYQSLE